MTDVDCKELQKDLDAATGEVKEALNELYDRSSELTRAADRIDDAHDYFDTGNMTDREIVDAQLDLVEQAREDTAREIRDLNAQDDWRDAGAHNPHEDRLSELNDQMRDLDETQEYLGNLEEAFDAAADKFDKAEQEKSDALKDWSEHCEDDLDVDEEEEADPRRPKHPEEEHAPVP